MGLGLGWKLKDIPREGMGMKKGYTLKWWNMMGDERNSYTLEKFVWDVDEKNGMP
jgi:hypothetical protein